jgi:hypothetical protein
MLLSLVVAEVAVDLHAAADLRAPVDLLGEVLAIVAAPSRDVASMDVASMVAL